MIREEQCKFALMLPYHVQQILSRENLWKNMLWRLSFLCLTGQPPHSAVVKNAMAKMPEAISVVYDSSELGTTTLKTVLDPDRYEDYNNGKPLPGMEVKIVDEELKEIPPGTGKLGEIIVCPDIKVLGYISNEEAALKSTVPGGWFRTGDVGYFNNDGDLFVICHTSFVIMRSAYLLHPGWLEARISTHPAVETVLVVPVPDPVLHQELCACVVTKSGASLTAEELREFCHTLFLTDSSDHLTAVPPYLVPKTLNLPIFVHNCVTNSARKPSVEIMTSNMDTVPHMLHHWATHQPDNAAFIFKDSTMRRRILTRADVYRLAARFASILRRDGVRRGDVVCNTLPNSPERVVSDFGIMLAGAAAMNGQIFLADGADFIGSLRDAECKAVILPPLQPKGAMSFLASLGTQELTEGTVYIQKLPVLNRIYVCHWERQGEVSSFMDMLELQQNGYVADVTADDIACIWTTSGSTGFSKLVSHSHSSFSRLSLRSSASFGLYHFPHFPKHNKTSANGDAEHVKTASSLLDRSMPKIITCCNTDDVDFSDHPSSTSFKKDKCQNAKAKNGERVTRYSKLIFFNNGKLGWSGGFPAGFLAVGATRVLVDLSRGPPSDPAAFMWSLIRQEQCKFAIMLPYHMQQILSREDLWRNMPWKLSTLSLAGQPVHAALVKNAMAIMTESINVFYGTTELGATALKTVLDPDKYEDCNNGKPFHGIEVKIADEKLKEVSSAIGKMGEIIVRPDIKPLGYISNEQATQKSTLPDGWFRTGDVGYFNDEGDLFVICRTSFVIMRGAYLLHPGWLEARISTHPAVETVLVVPVPDPVLHQELCACVVTKSGASLTAEELREFCHTLFLTDSSDHMTAVPPYFLFFSALPTTTTGKPCRQSTTKEARARLEL